MSTLVDTRDYKYNIKVAYICARIEICQIKVLRQQHVLPEIDR